MGLFGRLFGAKPPLERLRQAVRQQAWAEALSYRDEIEPATLPPEEQQELTQLLTTAGDSLARVNLAEGIACASSGDHQRAEEHFTLAARQACSPALEKEIASARKQQPKPKSRRRTAAAATAGIAPPSSTVGEELEHTGGEGLYDPHIAIELIAGGYPEEWQPRYEQLQGLLLRAVLAAHEGHFQRSLGLFEQVPPAERDDIYWFELGALQARARHTKLARQALKEALALNPGHTLALDTMVRLELGANRPNEAEQILRPLMQQDPPSPTALGLMAFVAMQQGRHDRAIELARRSLEGGKQDPEVMLLLAQLLERQGQLGEAERLLVALGPEESNLHLAEFHLRRGKHLHRIANLFRAALKQEPDNPRWLLRVAQCHLAMGWHSEAQPLLDRLAEERDLPEVLKLEVVEALKSLQSSKG